MTSTFPRTASASVGRAVSRRKTVGLFARNEDGSLIIFSLFMFVLMIMIAGISLDVERFEVVRTKLQNTADGAALTAASLTQDIDAETIVRSYFDVAGMATFYESVAVVEEAGSKQVTVFTDVHVPTHFMNMIGIPELAAPVVAAAAESVTDIEISLVLDVSGSMGQNSKLVNLQVAAKDFIDTIYNTVEADTVSTSIVPYSTQVNIGEDVMMHMQAALEDPHNRSHCIDFTPAHFETTALDLASTYRQSVHFDARVDWWNPEGDLGIEECSTRDWFEVMVMSQNTTDLKNYIDAFQATDWTSIELGAKWGAALLDPSFQPIANAMSGDGTLDPAFAARPASHADTETLKVMVLMTDGINTNEHRMTGIFRNGISNVFVWRDAMDRPYYTLWGGVGDPLDVNGVPVTEVNGWYLANDYSGGADEGWMDTPFGADEAVRLTWDDVWAEIPVEHFTDTILQDMGGQDQLRTDINDAIVRNARAQKDPNTLAICTSAKDEGITIYTISFEAPEASVTLLRNCASSPSHAFNVEGTEIGLAFAAIAADISRLRLLN